ncbi:MAG TPA: hypothetical protein VEK15_05665 [Vicinamibacteria bacterium]|nr:hypothetical protein [Vicinamibacteria bacterium]
MLFSDRSILTMVHGLVFGGGALLVLAAALYALCVLPGDGARVSAAQSRSLSRLLLFGAVLTWCAVLGGTYLVFPPYRTTPPEGATDLSRYPRSFLLGNPDTAWLHAFAMEEKEHVPWVAAMLATAAAFVSVRYRAVFANDRSLRRMVTVLVTVGFVLVGWTALLGTFINKVAPLE